MSYMSEKREEIHRLKDLAKQYTFSALRVAAEIVTDETATKRERSLAARMIAVRTTLCRRCKEPLLFCGLPIPGGRLRYRKRLVCEQCVLSGVRETQKRIRLTPDGRAKKLCASARRRAAELGVDFDLDARWVEQRITVGRCEVTSLPFELAARGKGRQHPFAPSLDRKDSSLGYTKANVRVVVWIHNLAKSDWDDACVLRYAQALLTAKTTH